MYILKLLCTSTLEVKTKVTKYCVQIKEKYLEFVLTYQRH